MTYKTFTSETVPARPEPDVRDVATPYLIDPLDRDLAQQIRIHPVAWMRLARPRLWPYRLDAHQPHHPLHPLPVHRLSLAPESHLQTA